MAEQYDELAAVYDLLVPAPLRTPEGAAAAFAEWVEGPRVLDCACGTGQLAVGLARRGFEVSASDASPGMIRRARQWDAPVRFEVRRWEDLAEGEFDTVLCVGNSLAHSADRPAALAGMRRALRDGGRLVLTSRDWERPRPDQPGYRWNGDSVEITAGGVTERLTFHPFTKAQLLADLDDAGFDVELATEGERYLVLSRARGRAARARRPSPRAP